MIENLTLNNLHFSLKPPEERKSFATFSFSLLSPRQGRKERKLFRFFLCTKKRNVAKKKSSFFFPSTVIGSIGVKMEICFAENVFPFPYHSSHMVNSTSYDSTFLNSSFSCAETRNTFSHFKDTKWFLNCFCPVFLYFMSCCVCEYVCEVLENCFQHIECR